MTGGSGDAFGLLCPSYSSDRRCDPRRYYEILEKDTLKFGNSSRKVHRHKTSPLINETAHSR